MEYLVFLKMGETLSEWDSPWFIIPKKNGTVIFSTDFRDLNKIQINTFPIKNIQNSLDNIEIFQIDTVTGFKMGYYDTRIYYYSYKLFIIVLQWGKYQYQILSMIFFIALDRLKEKISTIFQYMAHVCVYMDDLVFIINYTLKIYGCLRWKFTL